MSGSERVRGIQVHRPIIYGSHARFLTEEEKATAPPGHTHRWTVFLASAASPPPPADGSAEDPNTLPGGADDLMYMIKRITFRLHDTYTNPSRIFDKPPFAVSETGWGEFAVQIRVQFVNEAGEKPLTLHHPIRLHHWGQPIEDVPPTAPTPTEGQADKGNTPTVQNGTATATATSDQTRAQTPSNVNGSEEIADAAKKEEGEGEGDGITVKPEISTPAASAAADPPTDAGEIIVSMEGAAKPLSLTQKLPVLSWQYDEIVFTDPPAAFVEILNQHVPSPLPGKNRRPRDQREAETGSGAGKKKSKGRVSSILASGGPGAGRSRANTLEPAAGATGNNTPEPGAGGGSLIPGDKYGGVDIPLEFTKEIEQAELNLLNDARITIVQQMDKRREHLISLEKELVKMKQELGLA